MKNAAKFVMQHNYLETVTNDGPQNAALTKSAQGENNEIPTFIIGSTRVCS